MPRSLKQCPYCNATLGKPRSLKAHRYFFALIQRAFENWPDDETAFQPDSLDHLRAWLLVKAKHRTIIAMEPGEEQVAFLIRLLALTRASGGFAFPAEHNGQIVIATPKSISWSELDQPSFAPIAESVYRIIEDVLGTDLKTLKAQAKETERD